MTTIEASQPKASASFAAQTAMLAVGECASRTIAVNTSIPFQVIQAQLPTIRADLRNGMYPAIRSAKAKTNGTYSLEVFDCMSDGRNWYVVGVVTRQS